MAAGRQDGRSPFPRAYFYSRCRHYRRIRAEQSRAEGEGALQATAYNQQVTPSYSTVSEERTHKKKELQAGRLFFFLPRTVQLQYNDAIHNTPSNNVSYCFSCCIRKQVDSKKKVLKTVALCDQQWGSRIYITAHGSRWLDYVNYRTLSIVEYRGSASASEMSEEIQYFLPRQSSKCSISISDRKWIFRAPICIMDNLN